MAKRKQKSGGFSDLDFLDMDKVIQCFPDISKAFLLPDLSKVFPPIKDVFKGFDEAIAKLFPSL